MSGQGKESYIQLGTEAVGAWGTVVAATQNLEITEETFEPVPNYIDDPSLFDGFGPRDIILAGLRGEGTISHRANYEGHLQEFRAFFGGYTNSPIDGVRDHFFKEGDQRSLSARLVKGNIPSGQCWHVPGLRFSKMTFNCQAEQLATLSFDGIGKDCIEGQALTAGQSFPAVLPVKFDHASAGLVNDGTGDSDPLQIKGIKITSTRPLDGPVDVGSINMQEPDLSQLLTVEWEITYRFKTVSAATKLRAGTVALLTTRWRDPSIIGTTSHYEFEFTTPQAKCVGFKPPVRGYGRIELTAVWRALYDSGLGTVLQLRVRNTEAALT